MPRFYAILLFVLMAPATQGADAFDLYTNPLLARVPKAEGVKALERVTPEQLIDHDRLLPGLGGALMVVRTNEGRWSKLLLESGRQKASSGKLVPMISIDRFVTFREGQDEAIQASARGVTLFPGFRLNLDLGQIVPEELGGDLRFVSHGDQVYLEPLKEARLFLLTKPLPEAQPRKGQRLVAGEKFELRHINGTYYLHDDGRRSGRLTLKAADDGDLTGTFVSDRDGASYEVRGRAGTPPYAVEFSISFPRSQFLYKGWLFSGDARAIAGTSRLGSHEASFFAVRTEGR